MFHGPTSLAILYSIAGLLNDMYVLKVFNLIIIWLKINSRMWMSGVGILCAYAHYRASLLLSKIEFHEKPVF